MDSSFRQSILVALCFGASIALTPAHAQTAGDNASSRALALGFAVDTMVVPGSWWGVDPARASLPDVVRAWRDYILMRHDASLRSSFWSDADRARSTDPDPLMTSESYLLDGRPLLVEAVPLVAGSSDRWLLRTVYVGGGSTARPGLFGMERSYIVREVDKDGRHRWVLASPLPFETAGWRRVRVGLIEYVVHPTHRFDAARARGTAQWAEALLRRFGITDRSPVTYYQVPDLQAGFRVLGLEWVLSADRVGGRASPDRRFVIAGDPRYGEAYHHELVHVLLHPLVQERSALASEGIAYWLGGARGLTFVEMMRSLAVFLSDRPNTKLADVLSNQADGAIGSATLPMVAALLELTYRRSGDGGVLRVIEALGGKEPTITGLARALDTTPQQLEADLGSLIQSFAR